MQITIIVIARAGVRGRRDAGGLRSSNGDSRQTYCSDYAGARSDARTTMFKKKCYASFYSLAASYFIVRRSRSYSDRRKLLAAEGFATRVFPVIDKEYTTAVTSHRGYPRRTVLQATSVWTMKKKSQIVAHSQARI